MPNAVVAVEQNNPAKAGERIYRVATRVPHSLRQALKIQAAVKDLPLKALYALAVKQFMQIAFISSNSGRHIQWKQPRTSARKDRHGGMRGEEDWTQVFVLLPESDMRELDAFVEASGQSTATFAYTALEWYAEWSQASALSNQVTASMTVRPAVDEPKTAPAVQKDLIVSSMQFTKAEPVSASAPAVQQELLVREKVV